MSSFSEATGYIDRLSDSFDHGSSRRSDSAMSAAALNVSSDRYSSPSRTRPSTGQSSTYNTLASSGSREYTRSSTSVLSAFRELQSKAKRLELSRSEAIRQCDDLRDQIFKKKQLKELWQRQNEDETKSSVISLRAQCEQLKRTKDDFESKLRMLEEQQGSYQRSLAAQKSRLANLEEDVTQINSKIRAAKFKRESTAQDLSGVEVRCDNLDHEVITSPLKHKRQTNNKRESVTALEQQIENVKRATFKTHIKTEALQKYVELMMNINGDLCTTLSAREMTKDRILELAKKYAPPRYSWPKHFEYVDMVKLLTDAAMTAAKDGALARATAATIAAVGLSPYRSSSPLRSSLTKARPKSAQEARHLSFSDAPMSLLTASLLDSSIGGKKKKVKRSKKTSVSANIDLKLAKTAARIASMTIPTHDPDVDSIPSYRLAMSARGRLSGGYVSPTAVRDTGPAIHGDQDGVFMPSGSYRKDERDFSLNKIAQRSMASRSINQSVAQFHSTVKSLHGDGDV